MLGRANAGPPLLGSPRCLRETCADPADRVKNLVLPSGFPGTGHKGPVHKTPRGPRGNGSTPRRHHCHFCHHSADGRFLPGPFAEPFSAQAPVWHPSCTTPCVWPGRQGWAGMLEFCCRRFKP